MQIRGQWFYLYRAVDKQGRTIDFLLRPDRGIAAAQAFFRKAVATNNGRGPARSRSMGTSRADGRYSAGDRSSQERTGNLHVPRSVAATDPAHPNPPIVLFNPANRPACRHIGTVGQPYFERAAAMTFWKSICATGSVSI